MTEVVLLAHGSPDARAGVATQVLAEAVAQESGLMTNCAFLDYGVTLHEVLTDRAAAGCTEVVVVPLFLSAAFHVKVDVPAAIEEARSSFDLTIHLAAHLGIDDAVVEAVNSQVPEGPLVIAVAGTRDAQAQDDLEALANRWSALRGEPVAVGHASMGPKNVAAALAEVEGLHGRQAGVVAMVLFPGVLPDRINDDAGERFVSEPLYMLPAIAESVVGRVRATQV